MIKAQVKDIFNLTQSGKDLLYKCFYLKEKVDQLLQRP